MIRAKIFHFWLRSLRALRWSKRERKNIRRRRKKEEEKRKKIQVWKFGIHVWNSCLEISYLELLYGFVG